MDPEIVPVLVSKQLADRKAEEPWLELLNFFGWQLYGRIGVLQFIFNILYIEALDVVGHCVRAEQLMAESK
jgi:hypothetical protein